MSSDLETARVPNENVFEVFEPELTKRERVLQVVVASVVLSTLVYMIIMCASGMMVDIFATICFYVLGILFFLGITSPLLGSTTLVVVGVLGITMTVSVTDRAWGIIAVSLFGCWSLAGLVVFVTTVCKLGGCKGFFSADQWWVRTPVVLRPSAAAVRRVRCGGCALRCCGFTWCLGYALFMLFAVFASVVFIISEDLCAVGSYYAEYASPHRALSAGLVPPMELATDENVDIGALPQDLTGIWWLRWDANPVPLYGQMKLEVLVSWAGALNTSDSGRYPVQVASPTGLARHWGFSNSLAGRIAMMVASRTDPASWMNFDFDSETHINIHGAGEFMLGYTWTMDRIDEHEWVRTIYRGAEDQAWHYTLTRIVTMDGQETEHFKYYVQQLGGVKLRVFTTSNRGCRRCGSLPFGTKTTCATSCEGEW